MNAPLVKSNFLRKGFTLIELLVVIAVIGILAAVIMASLNSARAKARDAKRAADMDQIYKALNLYYDTYGCLPITTASTCGVASGSYSESNAGGWDYSSQGDFLTFLTTAGLMAPVEDPINNMTGDGSPADTYAYKYYCYPSGTSLGLHLGYWRETNPTYITWATRDGAWTDNTFSCQ